jgi:mannose-6-phosphate isomerase class I
LALFGPSFPIRFDYLDTVDGGDLSVHCHPRGQYMRDVFGVPVAQHESYYVVATRPAARIFLGLRDDADVAAFRDGAARSRASNTPFVIEDFVRTFPAVAHQLYLIPAGTPHGSGEGNVVLEISSTPYLYSLRFYDWVRADRSGTLRPVQLEHAFANLDPGRRGPEVGQLVRESSVVRTGPGFVERDLGRHPDLFFAVRRLDLDGGVAPEDTAGTFHVLALVEGRSAIVETARGDAHPLAFGESLIVPARVGTYRVRPLGAAPHKVIKAFVDQ